MKLVLSPAIRQKLKSKNPPITEDDVIQAFSNRDGKYLEDTREDHKSNPPTQWFVSQTDYGLKLKVVFIYRPDKGVFIRSAYQANADEIRIYEKYGKQGKL
ncbi:hypothetical protein [Pantoea ananatis]|uniref:hypothetical protein n=1 Tax=Pantoea ananas TaxID=553 RepID=UPI001F4DA5E3|nr:hypothetical protein [Pantoea ananatis]MCH9269040.1 hypothetical protein [Pantoea ananatis]